MGDLWKIKRLKSYILNEMDNSANYINSFTDEFIRALCQNQLLSIERVLAFVIEEEKAEEPAISNIVEKVEQTIDSFEIKVEKSEIPEEALYWYSKIEELTLILDYINKVILR